MQQQRQQSSQLAEFESINQGFGAVFNPGRLSVGLVVPIETYAESAVPEMRDHLQRVQLAESYGFAAVWLRDVPFNVPSFGDAGQIYDPLVYLGALATQTSRITLGVASLILPLRHPAHVAKAAATADVLSNGRLIIGVASGDRPLEYPALGQSFEARGRLFRESYEYIRNVTEPMPRFGNAFGRIDGGIDMLPKPTASKTPLLITGSSQQSPEWIAANGDGWMTYPRSVDAQSQLIDSYRARVAAAGERDKPVMEPLYIDLARDPDTPPRPIHLGLRLGINSLREYLQTRQRIGVNHVALNLRFNRSDTAQTLAALAEHILPDFSQQEMHDD
ncbi:MAG: LLM class oxidoreductase [Pseudomonadota bacterium]